MSATLTFPTVKGANLEGRRFTLPADLEGELNVLLIPFQRWHQELVDTWIPGLRALCARYPALRYYELPTLPAMNPLSRMGIDFGMKMGIPDRAAREATITLYLDKADFRRRLAIPDESTVTVMAVARSGAIHWRTTGAWRDEAGQALATLLQLYFNAASPA
jgi:hypothetical protein